MALELNGTTGVSLVQDGVVTAADIATGAVGATQLASTLDLTGKTITLPSGVGGKVIQSVHDTQVSNFVTTSSTYVAQGLSVTITPTSTSSKIYLQLSCMYDTNNTQTVIYTYYRTIGGGSATNIFTAGNGIEGLGGAQSTNRGSIGAIAVDSPNTTSSVTYALYIRNGSGGTIEFPPFGSMTQFLVATEVGA